MRTIIQSAGQEVSATSGLAATPRLQNETACESVQDIINVAVTAEAFAVTLLGVAIENATNGTLALNGEQIQTLAAARAAEQAHYQFLIGSGAVPQTTTFTLPDPKIVTDVPTLLTTLITLEEVAIAAYLAAAQEFAILGETRLAQTALQIGAVEAEHRVGLRYYAIEAGVLSGTANDVAFEKALFSRVAEAAAALQSQGFIGGSGTSYTYPGPGTIDTSGVTQLQP